MKAKKFFIDAINAIPPEIQKQVDYSMSISDSIAHALASKKMSQKEFAKKIGRSEAEVSRWLSGRHNFTLSSLTRISTVLGNDIIRVQL